MVRVIKIGQKEVTGYEISKITFYIKICVHIQREIVEEEKKNNYEMSREKKKTIKPSTDTRMSIFVVQQCVLFSIPA